MRTITFWFGVRTMCLNVSENEKKIKSSTSCNVMKNVFLITMSWYICYIAHLVVKQQSLIINICSRIQYWLRCHPSALSEAEKRVFIRRFSDQTERKGKQYPVKHYRKKKRFRNANFTPITGVKGKQFPHTRRVVINKIMY